jgi:hypothetical protein
VIAAILAVSLAACSDTASPDKVARKDEWSKPVDGLRVRLVSDRPVYEEGQNVFLELDVFNASKESVTLARDNSLRARLILRTVGGELLKQRSEPPAERIRLVRSIAPGKQTNLMVFYVSGNQYASYAPLKPGKYEATWPAGEDEKIAGARLAPAAQVSFEVVPKRPAAGCPGSEVSDVPWGEPKGGLQTRLSADCARFPAGSPIPVTVEIRNTSEGELHYEARDVAINGGIRLLDATGRPVPYIHGSAQTGSTQEAIGPGRKAVLDAVDLCEYYYLGAPKWSTSAL